jgi:REP element-mobilizing transposase RayT
MVFNRKSMRIKDYDYTQSGIYFVTIRTRNHAPFFGSIKNGRICLSKMGKIAHKYWNHIPKHFNHIHIDKFVIMPNHMHGILIICNNPTMFYKGTVCRAPINNRSPLYFGAFKRESFGKPCKGSIPTVIRSYKSAVTRFCRKHEYKYFGWHRNYYLQIIHDEKDLYAVRRYIVDNPINWRKD